MQRLLSRMVVKGLHLALIHLSLAVPLWWLLPFGGSSPAVLFFCSAALLFACCWYISPCLVLWFRLFCLIWSALHISVPVLLYFCTYLDTVFDFWLVKLNGWILLYWFSLSLNKVSLYFQCSCVLNGGRRDTVVRTPQHLHVTRSTGAY